MTRDAAALDGAGSACVTGFFKNAAKFGTTQLRSLGAPQWIEKDVFIAKSDATGAPQWARSAGGRGTDVGYRIAVDAAETGQFDRQFHGRCVILKNQSGWPGNGVHFRAENEHQVTPF